MKSSAANTPHHAQPKQDIGSDEGLIRTIQSNRSASDSTAATTAPPKGYDPIEVKQRTCQTCGMLLDDAGEYHPYVFCVLKKAGRDPWREIRTVALQLHLVGDPGERPPLIREIHGLR